MSGRHFNLSHFSHLTVITLQAFYVYLAGKKTTVKFAGLAGGYACDEKGVQFVNFPSVISTQERVFVRTS